MWNYPSKNETEIVTITEAYFVSQICIYTEEKGIEVFSKDVLYGSREIMEFATDFVIKYAQTEDRMIAISILEDMIYSLRKNKDLRQSKESLAIFLQSLNSYRFSDNVNYISTNLSYCENYLTTFDLAMEHFKLYALENGLIDDDFEVKIHKIRIKYEDDYASFVLRQLTSDTKEIMCQAINIKDEKLENEIAVAKASVRQRLFETKRHLDNFIQSVQESDLNQYNKIVIDAFVERLGVILYNSITGDIRISRSAIPDVIIKLRHKEIESKHADKTEGLLTNRFCNFLYKVVKTESSDYVNLVNREFVRLGEYLIGRDILNKNIEDTVEIQAEKETAEKMNTEQKMLFREAVKATSRSKNLAVPTDQAMNETFDLLSEAMFLSVHKCREKLLTHEEKVLKTEVVRLPAPILSSISIKRPQDYAVCTYLDGVASRAATGVLNPSDTRFKNAIPSIFVWNDKLDAARNAVSEIMRTLHIENILKCFELVTVS